MTQSSTRREACRAFTLVEVLLVLALLVIISGVAWTAIQGPLARQRLRSAADAVRSAWCQARDDAMKSGHTYAFRYLVRGNRYHVGAQDDRQPAADASPATQAPATQAPAAQASTPQTSTTDEEESGDDPLPPPIEKTLPQGVRFLNADKGGDLAALSDGPATAAADDTGDWSDPIYFYSDGSTSDAQLLLAGDRHSALRLQLRGVTGAVTVGDVNAITQ